MSIEFKEKKASPIEFPKAKTIVIDGKQCGDVTPSISADRLSWHACIKLSEAMVGPSCGLVQGYGPSPAAAVANAILTARQSKEAWLERLAWLEQQTGSMGRSDEELKSIK